MEVIIKNISLLVLFSMISPQISFEFEELQRSNQSGVLSMLGFLMTGGIIGAFELSYTKTMLNSITHRYLAHASKFLLYLAICILIWIGYKTMGITGGYFNDWILIAGGLIIGAIFIYDAWDAVSAVDKYQK